MNSDRPSPSSWSVAGVYLFGILLFCWPFIDLVTNALPIRLGNLHWRYGFGGLLAAYLNTPILGIVILMAVAYGLRHTRFLRFLSAFDLVMAVGLLVVIVVFALDLVQVRASRSPAAQASTLAGGSIAIAKHFTAAVVLALLGIGGWRTGGKWKRAAQPSGKSGPTRIVMPPKAPTGSPQPVEKPE